MHVGFPRMQKCSSSSSSRSRGEQCLCSHKPKQLSDQTAAWVLAQDKSWRVRYNMANQLVALCEALGPDVIR